LLLPLLLLPVAAARCRLFCYYSVVVRGGRRRPSSTRCWRWRFSRLYEREVEKRHNRWHARHGIN
jgi:hypothetical protein